MSEEHNLHNIITKNVPLSDLTPAELRARIEKDRRLICKRISPDILDSAFLEFLIKTPHDILTEIAKISQ